jgi:tetratricopeptide (TPR) repeat protein
VYNDLGLCLARQNQLEESRTVLEQAIQLQPDRKLYRNNCAKLLVDLGRPEQAYNHLAAVHPPAEAQYNLGYLLSQKGDQAAAYAAFAKALELAPQMTEARQWMESLQAAAAPAVQPLPQLPQAAPQIPATPVSHSPQQPWAAPGGYGAGPNVAPATAAPQSAFAPRG